MAGVGVARELGHQHKPMLQTRAASIPHAHAHVTCTFDHVPWSKHTMLNPS